MGAVRVEPQDDHPEIQKAKITGSISIGEEEKGKSKSSNSI